MSDLQSTVNAAYAKDAGSGGQSGPVAGGLVAGEAGGESI